MSGEGAFNVECNTAYAMTLERSGIYAAPPRQAVARGPSGNQVALSAIPLPVRITDAGGRAQAPTVAANADEMGDLGVLLRVAGRPELVETDCKLAHLPDADGAPVLCDALAGPEDVRLPAPRTVASLIVTGSLATRRAEADEGTAVTTGSVAPEGNAVAPVDIAQLPLVQRLQGVNPAEAAAADRDERLALRRASARAQGRRIGDRLKVSLTARF